MYGYMLLRFTNAHCDFLNAKPKHSGMCNKKLAGFTRIEFVIVIAVIGIVVSAYARTVKPVWAVEMSQMLAPFNVFFQVPFFAVFALGAYDKMKNTRSRIEKFAYFVVVATFLLLIPVVIIKHAYAH